MDSNRIQKVLKKLGYSIIRENKHIKCKDSNGNIHVVSRKYLERCMDNPKFMNTIKSNKCTWLKNKSPEYISNKIKGGTQ